MLHCTHHVCLHHLDQLQSSGQGLVPCPVCSDVTQVPPGGLQVDRSLQLVQEYWEDRKLQQNASLSGRTTPPLCGLCEEKPASRRCIQCDGDLCEACVVATHSKGFFKSHQIVDLLEEKPATETSLVARMICDVHPQEKLSFYCLDCRMPVCSHCLILGDHKGHQQKHIEEAYDTGKDTLNAWVEKLQQRIESCEDILDKIRNAELDVNQGAAAQRNVINHEMDHLKELIETKRHQLLSKSGLEEKQKRATLQDQNERTSTSRSDARGLIHRSQELLAVGSEHAFLAVVLPLIQDMKKLCQQPPEVPPTVNGNFRPLMTDPQVRSLGDLDLGLLKQAPAQVVLPSYAMSHISSDAGHGYALAAEGARYQVSNPAPTVSYLSAAPSHGNNAQQVSYHTQMQSQVVYRTAMPAHS